MVPTGTPGMGPKWLEGTMVHCLVLPTHAIPCSQQEGREGQESEYKCTYTRVTWLTIYR